MASSSIFARNALLSEGWAQNVRVSIDASAVTSISHDASSLPSDTLVDYLTPSLGNLHSHAFQRAFSGLTEIRGNPTDTFWTWREVMYRCALSIQPDELEAIAAQLYVEMLEAGFCRVGEFHYLHHNIDGQPYDNIGEMIERIGAASAEAGISLTLLPSFYAHGNFGGAAPLAGQARFVNTLDQFERVMEVATACTGQMDGGIVGVAPHSLRAVTPLELARTVELARDGPIHIHASEQVKEVEDCLHWSGKRPVRWLLDNVEINQNWCLIHATHMDETEVADLAAAGGNVGLCPITEANLGDGIFPAKAFLAQNGQFGIGSDSNVNISAGGELSQLEYSQRLTLRNRNVLAVGAGSTGQDLFAAAVRGAARSLKGTEDIHVGGEANFISFDRKKAPWIGADTLLDSWIFGMDQKPDNVWSRGKLMVKDGIHIHRDAIRRRFDGTMERLRPRL